MNRRRALDAALGLLALAATASAAAAAAPARELRYSVLMMGNIAGTQVTRITPLETGELREMPYTASDTESDIQPRPSPDGRWLAFRRGAAPYSDLFLAPYTGG